jgi:hypothetical protein
MWHGTILRRDYNLFFRVHRGLQRDGACGYFPDLHRVLIERVLLLMVSLINRAGIAWRGKAAVFSEVDIQLDCRASLAFSSGGTTVL